MLRSIATVWLLGMIGFGVVTAAIPDLAALMRQPAPTAAPADAVPVARARTLAQIANSPETPLGDALFRGGCTWTLRDKLADRPDWTLRRTAAFCLCLADIARAQRLPDLPNLARSDVVALVEALEDRACRVR